MGCFDGYLFLTDMDGTLTVNEKLSHENEEAIAFFQKEGGLFTMATGRGPNYLDKYRPGLIPNAPIIAINGTAIYDREKEQMLFSAFLDEQAGEVPEYVRTHYDQLLSVSVVWSGDDWVEPFVTPSGKGMLAFLPKEAKVFEGSFLDYAASIPKPWYKVIMVVQSEASGRILEDLRHRFGDRYKFNRSWPEGIEMHSIDSGKDVCAKWMRDHSEGRIHTIVAAGDYENDLDMILYADIGYAVGNAVDSVKEAADRITVPNTEHAIAAIIKELYKEIQ